MQLNNSGRKSQRDPVNIQKAWNKLVSEIKYKLKVHKHEIFCLTFLAETETIRSQGPVTRDF